MDYPALLVAAVLLLGLNAFVHGWLFTLGRLDEFPHRQPQLYHILGPRGRTALGAVVGLGDILAVILLFWIKWYAGLIGIATAYVGPLLFSRVLCAIRRSLGIPSTPEQIVADLVYRYPPNDSEARRPQTPLAVELPKPHILPQTAVQPLGDPLCVVVSREEVEARDIRPALAILMQLIESPAAARAYQERVDIGFDGYNKDRRELCEIPEVREYVYKLDEKFPFWLFFLSKHFLGLQCIIYCFLPPFLTDRGRAQIHPERLKDLLVRRWLPAMNQVAVCAGLDEDELRRLTDSAMQYATTGPLNVPETET